jgi:hypothetical protein
VTTATQSRLLTPAQIGRRCPPNREGAPVSPTTVVRWIVNGVRRRDGGRLRLPALRYPGGWRIAEDDFERFIAALTQDRTGAPPSPLVEARAGRAMAALVSDGF